MAEVFGESIFNGNATFFGDTTFFGDITAFSGIEATDINITGKSQLIQLDVSGNVNTTGITTASKFVVTSGTSNAFLKADGSLDTATYVTAATVGGAVDNTGGQLVLRSGTGGFSAGIVTTTSLTVNGNAKITGIVSTSSVTDLSGGYLSTPPGTIITIAASTAPAGFLKANGASLSTTTYASLFSTIGYTFGGSGASFTLPDLRGEFIRGWADDRAVDTGRTFGSSQTDDFKSHTHTFTDYYNTTFSVFSNSGWSAGNRWANTSANVTDAAPTTGGTETRPRNIALLYCIKY